MMIQDDLLYSKDHEWIRIGDDDATVGISDYAQEELGDITFVEMPDVGKDVERREELGVIESVKAASDMYAPVAGTISAVNGTLDDMPETINRDPYGDGWVCRMVNWSEEQLADLMSPKEYEEYINGL